MTEMIDVDAGQGVQQDLHAARCPSAIAPAEPVHVERELVRRRFVRVEEPARERPQRVVESVIRLHLADRFLENLHAAGDATAVRPRKLIHDERDLVGHGRQGMAVVPAMVARKSLGAPVMLAMRSTTSMATIAVSMCRSKPNEVSAAMRALIGVA